GDQSKGGGGEKNVTHCYCTPRCGHYCGDQPHPAVIKWGAIPAVPVPRLYVANTVGAKAQTALRDQRRRLPQGIGGASPRVRSRTQPASFRRHSSLKERRPASGGG